MTDLEETPEPHLNLDFWVINYIGEDATRLDERTAKYVAEIMELGTHKTLWITDIYGSETLVIFSRVNQIWHINQDIRSKIAEHNKLLEETNPAVKKFD